MKFCFTCREWYDSKHIHHCPGGPDDGHKFFIDVRTQGEGHDWVSEPISLMVRAKNLSSALEKALGVPLASWKHPEEEE